MILEKTFARCKRDMRHGPVVCFVGAGISKSRPSSLPLGGELRDIVAAAILRRAGFLHSELNDRLRLEIQDRLVQSEDEFAQRRAFRLEARIPEGIVAQELTAERVLPFEDVPLVSAHLKPRKSGLWSKSDTATSLASR